MDGGSVTAVGGPLRAGSSAPLFNGVGYLVKRQTVQPLMPLGGVVPTAVVVLLQTSDRVHGSERAHERIQARFVDLLRGSCHRRCS